MEEGIEEDQRAPVKLGCRMLHILGRRGRSFSLVDTCHPCAYLVPVWNGIDERESRLAQIPYFLIPSLVSGSLGLIEG